MEIGKRYRVEYLPAGAQKSRFFVATLLADRDGTLVFNMRPAAGTQELDKRQLIDAAPTDLPHGT